jgi:sulfate permease, SulP family
MKVQDYMPSLTWLRNYRKKDIKGDLSAGLTVGVMLIPQGMAYAMIAGLPPIYGLYASTVPLILYALFGTSRQLAVGPVAMVSLLTAAGVGALAEVGSQTFIALAITLALMVGLIQFLLGVFRLGFLVNFLSHPVISGFTSAAALIIGLSQLKHLLGVDIERSHHIHEILIQAFEQAGAINWITLGIGLGGIVLIKGIKRINRSIPGPLLAVLFGILVVFGFGLTEYGVLVVGTVPEGLPAFSLPNFDRESLSALLPVALTISLVGFMESIAVAKAIQAKHRNYQVIPNQELIGLGLANIGGAFFQSYPVTGGFSRTAVNDQAGAKTGLASIISAALIILTLLFLTPLFYYLPKAILASVIMVAVFGLIDIKEAVHLWKSNRTDFAMLLVTFLATLSLGIEQGIGVGVVLSLVMVIYRSTRPHYAILGNIPGTPYYRNTDRFDQLKEREDTLIFRFDADLYFANTSFFKEKLTTEIAEKGDALKNVVISAESISYVDSSAMHALEQVLEDLRKQNIRVLFSGVKGPLRDALTRAHLMEKIGNDNFYMNVEDAMTYLNNEPDSDQSTRHKYTMQTNL